MTTLVPLQSDIYDRQYFLSEKCEGWNRFRVDNGLSPIKQGQVRGLAPAPGRRVLDAGCGRGEVLLACARAGADVAGLDYSEAAVEITKEVLAEVPDADVRRGDVTALPWANASFDAVLFGDVIEHLDPDQAVAAIREFRRVLRPGGTLLVHTAPNLLFLKVTWPVAKLALRAIGRGRSAQGLDDWIGESKAYHVNEQTVHSLRRTMRSGGFADAVAWIDPNVLRGGDHHLTEDLQASRLLALAERIGRLRPVRMFLGNDLYAVGRA
ncbi:MAG TPA: methyltransferase domain-containing protein [Thermoleophilaceae bacterium]|nr:methyltransferase domain-containing protein [Thermoleophilaceae bacterium]